MHQHDTRDDVSRLHRRASTSRTPPRSERPIPRALLALQASAGNRAVHGLVAGAAGQPGSSVAVQRDWTRSYGHPKGELPPKQLTPTMVVNQVKKKRPYYVTGATQKDATKRADPVRGWIYTFYAYYRAVFSSGDQRWGIVLAAHTHVKQDGSKVAGNMFVPGFEGWSAATDPALVAQVPAYDASTHVDGWGFGDFGGSTFRYPTYWVVEPKVEQPKEEQPKEDPKVLEGAGL